LKLILNIFAILFISYSAFAEKIATVRLSYILNNSNQFVIFLDELEKIKTQYFNELEGDEKILNKRKSELEDSKLILNEEEFNLLIEVYNKDTMNYKKKIAKYENFLNDNMESNKRIILKKISEIVGSLSESNGYDLVINEDQYFLASNKLDISDIIIDILNKEKLNLKIIQQ
tara:strand:+ start:1377 stop:1895 length:519 start_codon:yes stop_codon:yes gene_type:complete